MKIFSFTLVLFVLFLSVSPCADGVGGEQVCESSASVSNHQSSGEQHHHSGEEEDFCSPFCVCTCCGVSAMLSSSASITNAESLVDGYLTFYCIQYSFLYFGSLLKPPSFI